MTSKLLSLLSACSDDLTCRLAFVDRCWQYANQLILPLCHLLQDYIKESDNLVSLHDQIHDCDNILSHMETLLSGFQVCWSFEQIEKACIYEHLY